LLTAIIVTTVVVLLPDICRAVELAESYEKALLLDYRLRHKMGF
jgi:hypothetical protein